MGPGLFGRLFLLLTCIKLNTAQLDTLHVLSWPTEFNAFFCEITYDTRDPSDVGPYSTCVGDPKMPCTCPISVLNNLLDSDVTDGFKLTDHSKLEFTVTLGDFYQLFAVSFFWHNVSNPLDTDASYIALYDLGSDGWVNQTYQVVNFGGISLLELIGDDFKAIIANQVRFSLNWIDDASDGFVYPTGVQLTGQTQTKHPTSSPSKSPSKSPTLYPTADPTSGPTKAPTRAPSTQPTSSPTKSPTYKSVIRQTMRDVGVDSIQLHSDNIIPLSQREGGNITYNNYHLPDFVRKDGSITPGNERPYCLTCILAWADIDASIELEGCPEVDEDGNSIWNYSDSNPLNPNSIYHCDTGTWRLKTSGRLADWQDTYGRVEIWEVDSRGIKWPHWRYEFNWWNSSCFFFQDDSDELVDCDVLPLTNDTARAAYFEFTMPKRWGDSRNAPLIAVWYDLLSIPYSIRPEIGYEYINMTFSPIEEGDDFGLEDALSTFQPALAAAGILLVCFIAVMLLSCFLSTDKKSKKDFMIDTRNLRTTFRHTPETIIVPPTEIQNRSRFSCARHGPWLLVVLVARLIYMFIFTFTFFWAMFQAFNDSHFDTLASYDLFATERDTQLVDLSAGVEIHYSNETDRMEKELQFRQAWCFNSYINETVLRFVDGGQHQQEYHTDQMNDPFGNINVNLSSIKNIFVVGDGQTACNPSQTDGAIIWINSKTAPVTYTPLITTEKINATDNTTYVVQEAAENSTVLYGEAFDTSFSNFSELESVLGPVCDKANWCYGWGFTNKDASKGINQGFYMMFNELADPQTLDGVSGVCYGAANLGEELSFLKFNASFFSDYTEKLNAQRIDDFQSYASDMYDTMNGLWSAIQDFPDKFHFNDEDGPFGNIDLHMNDAYNYNDTGDYGIDLDFKRASWAGSSGNGTQADLWLGFNIMCPNCPSGNFTENVLNFATKYFINGSNISDFTNLSNLPVNVSNLISINTAFIEFPDLPTIELPFDFDFPLDLSILANICISLDFLLLIYRWYRTTGIVARIVRGNDVDVSLSYLMVAQSEQRCCYGRSIIDYLLNCIIYCHDKIFRLSYNLTKVCFWVFWLLRIAIVALLVLMLYYLVDQILTVEFIEGIGTFQLMTVGIGAQRSVRNQVLCTTALSYNNYTLTNVDRAVTDYAQERNDDAWKQNLAELARVDEYNSLFCQGWVAYQTVSRDVTTESPNNAWVNLNDTDISRTTQLDKDEVKNVYQGTYYTYSPVTDVDDPTISLFDNDPTTYWRPYIDPSDAPINQDVIFDFYLSSIYMTDQISVGWDIVQITLNWRFEYDPTNVPIDNVTAISFEIYLEDANGTLTQIPYTGSNGNSYAPEVDGSPASRQSVSSYVQYITISAETDTSRVRVVFPNVELWGTEYYLNDIAFAGHAPESQIKCPQAKYRFWEFDGSSTKNENASNYIIWADDNQKSTYYDADGTYIEYCPQITPIHGLMYRGFVRSWLNEQLIMGHRPFILALRNIALSPFYIAIGLIGVLFMAYLFAFIMEWFLMKLDLYRENPYARVPLVTTQYDKYDATQHETGDRGTIYGLASVGEDYYNPTVSNEASEADLLATGAAGAKHKKHVESRDEIELGLTNDAKLHKHRGENNKRKKDESSSTSSEDSSD